VLAASAPAASARNHVFRVSVSGTQTIDWTFSGAQYCDQTGTQKISITTKPVVYQLFRKPYGLRPPGYGPFRRFPATASIEATATPTAPPADNPDCVVGYGSKCGTDGPVKFDLYADFDKPKAPVMRIGKSDPSEDGGVADENKSNLGKLDCGGPVDFRKNDSPPLKGLSALTLKKRFSIVSDRTFTTNHDDGRVKWHYDIQSHFTVKFVRVR
jgi:hypothetical protein